MSDRYRVPGEEVPESDPEAFLEGEGVGEGVGEGGPGAESEPLAPAERARARATRTYGKKSLANGRPMGSHYPFDFRLSGTPQHRIPPGRIHARTRDRQMRRQWGGSGDRECFPAKTPRREGECWGVV